MSSKRKSVPSKKGAQSRKRKVEYDEEDISSEHESGSEVEDADTGLNNDAEDAVEDDLTDVSSIPELPPPEVNLRIQIYIFFQLFLSCAYSRFSLFLRVLFDKFIQCFVSHFYIPSNY